MRLLDIKVTLIKKWLTILANHPHWHVNNTIYFQFYDSGKTDYVSTVCKGFDRDHYAIFVVKIEVKSRCLSILVLYDLEQKQSIPFSDEWRKAISDYDGL